MIRILILFFATVVIIASVSLLVTSLWQIIFTKSKKRLKADAINKVREENTIWSAAGSVRDLISNYINIINVHGPDSELARAFRFGTDNKALRDLHEDNKGLEAFNSVADVLDTAFRGKKEVNQLLNKCREWKVSDVELFFLSRVAQLIPATELKEGLGIDDKDINKLVADGKLDTKTLGCSVFYKMPDYLQRRQT